MRQPDRDGAADVVDPDEVEHSRVGVADGQYPVVGQPLHHPLGGHTGDLNIGKLVGKRLHVIGTALRGRPVEGAHGKGAIVDAVVASVWPMIGDGKVRPVIGARYPIQEAAEAHRALAAGETHGKVLLTLDG